MSNRIVVIGALLTLLACGARTPLEDDGGSSSAGAGGAPSTTLVGILATSSSSGMVGVGDGQLIVEALAVTEHWIVWATYGTSAIVRMAR